MNGNDKHSSLLRYANIYSRKKFYSTTGSTKANVREPKTCSGRVFNYKLGCFDDVHVLIYVEVAHIYS